MEGFDEDEPLDERVLQKKQPPNIPKQESNALKPKSTVITPGTGESMPHAVQKDLESETVPTLKLQPKKVIDSERIRQEAAKQSAGTQPATQVPPVKTTVPPVSEKALPNPPAVKSPAPVSGEDDLPPPPAAE